MTEKTCSDCLHKDLCEYRFSWLDQEDNTKHIICHNFQGEADVVPRAEVDLYRRQVDELEDELASTYDELEDTKAEVERLRELNNNLLEAGQEWQKRAKQLEYTLLGVMHSVDKWLEGEELNQDEVNRAATMREKTLQIVEGYQMQIKATIDFYEKREKEIFEDLESICLMHVDRYNRYLIYSEDFAKLKKKYTEGAKSD